MNGTLIKFCVILEQITGCRTNQIGNPMKVNIYLIHTINGIGIGVLVYVVQGCPIGFFGYNCTQPCRFPSFGEKCQSGCNCSRDFCDHITGCTSIKECDDGYYGQDCILPCKYPSYGGKCQQTCNCMPLICNNINGCENITEITEMLTTKSSEVFNFEWTFFNKHREAIITGSCSLLLIMAMCVWLKLKKCNKKPSRHFEEKIDQRFELYSSPSIDDVARASYASLELDEVSDPDYENTRFSNSSMI